MPYPALKLSPRMSKVCAYVPRVGTKKSTKMNAVAYFTEKSRDITENSLKAEPDLAVLEASNISKLYPTPEGILTVLEDINLKILPSESVAIVGVSGSGKTTLLTILAGLDLPSAGEISVAGNNITHTDEDTRAKIRAQHIGFVFQQFHLIPNLSALENICLPLELSSHASPEKTAREALREVGLSERADHYPNELSGGEQQRVALARAYCTHPSILLADEPTGNLDRKTSAQISDLLFDLNRQKNTTLILVTHDPTLAARCDRQITLVDGKTA